MSICLSVCLYICLSVCLYVRLPVCLFVFLSVNLSVCFSVCLPVYLSVCLFVFLSLNLSVCQRYYILQIIEHYNDDKLTNIYQDIKQLKLETVTFPNNITLLQTTRTKQSLFVCLTVCLSVIHVYFQNCICNAIANCS